MAEKLILLLYAVPAILISLSFHELSHAYVSYRLGDPTAKMMGRLTLNPLKHLDPVGTLLLLISMYSGFGFGWAKPVPIDPSYYKNHKRGTVLVSLAGPVSNLLLAFVFSFPMAYIALKNTSGITISDVYNSNTVFTSSAFSIQALIFYVCRYFYIVNIGLAVFNIIPIPPLDGSKILTAILPANSYFRLMQYERYIGLVFLAVMLLRPEFLYIIMSPFQNAVEGLFRIISTPLLSLLI